MGYIIMAIILLLAWIIALVTSGVLRRKSKADGLDSYDRRSYKSGALGTKIGAWVAFGLFVLFTALNSFVIIGVGHSAVTTFAGETQASLGNGFHVVPPWHNVVDYETRVKEYTMAGDGEGDSVEAAAVSAPTKDGSNVGLDLTVRYQISESSVDDIFEQYGSDEAFEEKVIFNDLRAVSRDVVVTYDALEARANREAIGPEIAERLQERWGAFARVELVNVRKLTLDPAVQEAANDVLRAEEGARERLFDEDRERTNANIARIQAQGVADSQQIIICGGTVQVGDDGTETVVPNEGESCQDQLSQELLVWKYIEALEAIGNDGNMVIISSGDASTDLILPAPTPAPVGD